MSLGGCKSLKWAAGTSPQRGSPPETFPVDAPWPRSAHLNSLRTLPPRGIFINPAVRSDIFTISTGVVFQIATRPPVVLNKAMREFGSLQN